MSSTALTVVIFVLTIICVASMFFRVLQEKSSPLTIFDYFKLGISGIIAFIADALGIGSFAVNVAMAKLLGTFPDDELPAVNNGAQVIPGAIESLYFMNFVAVDKMTMLTLVIGACIGGLLGGTIVSKLNKQAIRLSMMVCFVFIMGLLLCYQLQLMPLGGNVNELTGWTLVIGFVGMICCGAVTSVGIGLFVLVQGLLFLLHVSPLVAFPIMTVAGAMQQPLTTLVFLHQGKIPLKKTLILSLSGCIGVYLAILIFEHLTISWLHTLLLLIVAYNLIAISSAWFKERKRKRLSLYPERFKEAPQWTS